MSKLIALYKRPSDPQAFDQAYFIYPSTSDLTPARFRKDGCYPVYPNRDGRGPVLNG